MATRVGRGEVAIILNKAAATGAGDAFTPASRNAVFDLEITNTATVKLQVSFDGSTWRDLAGTTKTATAQLSIGEWYPFIRANVTAWTNGQVTVRMAVAPGG